MVASVIGALGIGSVSGQYVASSKDRREARAGVLSAIGDTEATRWTLPGQDGWDEFPADLRKLQTAALIARFPRDAVSEYCVLVQAAHWMIEASWDQSGGDRDSIGIDRYLSEARRESTRVITAIAWSWRPTHACRLAKRRIDRLLAQLHPGAVERARRIRVV
jgi:hypothetical protein